MPGIRVISDLSEFAALALAKDLLVVDFHATWCGPCKVISPHFEKFPAQYPNILFASVDIDQNQEIASQCQISSVPTFLFMSHGREVSRVLGANLPQLSSTLANQAALLAKSQEEKRAVTAESSAEPSTSSSASSASAAPSYKALLPKGFEILNDSIELRNLEVLNATSTKSASLTDSLRSLFNTQITNAPILVGNIESDADSQLLFYVPFQDANKVHSILIQSPVAVEGQVRQRPIKIKVWINLPSILSFDDVESVPAVHDAEIGQPDEQGWSVVSLRFVRFQRVSSLVIFFEGEDEDEPTAVNKIILAGTMGEKQEINKLAKQDEP
ncbi:PITH domain-containing protein [Lipomyces japonicus]|uniref:PITH domain-containing protein n=1 Tax=Lipomyces japonicus TaxID=56871 RepID=UPI0034CE3812